MPNGQKKIRAAFYRTLSGAEPVREWLRDLSPDDRKLIGSDIATVEYGWPIGMPTCRSLGQGLFEVRTDLPNGRTARVLFCITEGQLVLLHGFIKKTQATPPADLNLARSRQKDVK